MTSAAFPPTLHLIAIASLALAACCALSIAVDVRRHPQQMAVMNWVWPLAALFGSVIWLLLYLRLGRPRGKGIPGGDGPGGDGPGGDGPGGDGEAPMWAAVAKGASHCGAGCTLGDIIAEWAAFALPAIAIGLGWQSVFAERMFAVWILDYILAFALGVAFQYFAIAPMRRLSPGRGLVQAVKADFASITAWQVGMYGGMALIQLVWFRPVFGGAAPVNSPEFWFAMQLAMIAGFATAYPINWWLIRAGIKERM